MRIQLLGEKESLRDMLDRYVTVTFPENWKKTVISAEGGDSEVFGPLKLEESE